MRRPVAGSYTSAGLKLAGLLHEPIANPGGRNALTIACAVDARPLPRAAVGRKASVDSIYDDCTAWDRRARTHRVRAKQLLGRVQAMVFWAKCQAALRRFNRSSSAVVQLCGSRTPAAAKSAARCVARPLPRRPPRG